VFQWLAEEAGDWHADRDGGSGNYFVPCRPRGICARSVDRWSRNEPVDCGTVATHQYSPAGFDFPLCEMDNGCWSNGVDVWTEFSKVVVAADLMPVAIGVDRVDPGFDSAEVAGEVLAAAFVPLAFFPGNSKGCFTQA